jgi:esterase
VADHLNVRSTGQGDRAVVLLHGLFGSGNNLGHLARGLNDDFRVFSVDLPDHGRSSWLERPSIEKYAERVAQWMDSENLSDVLLMGHSLGGKVAMQMALVRSDLVHKLIVLDIAPKAYERRHDPIFLALRSVEAGRVGTRREARALLMRHLDDPQVADFLLTSAVLSDEGVLRWRFNLAGLEAGYVSILAAIGAGQGEVLCFDGPVLFVRGAYSDYVPTDTKTEFSPLFKRIQMVTVKNAGHWLHQEQPETVLTIARRFFAP